MKLCVRHLGQGQPLVLLHGWGMNLGVWGDLPERLADRYRMTLIELPGHGRSDCISTDNGLDDWVAKCLTLAPKRAIWLGWSLGAQVAMQAALEAPQRVAGLVSVAGSPRFVDGPDWPHAMREPVFAQFATTLRANPHKTLQRFLSLQLQGDDHAREALRELREAIAARPEPSAEALDAGLGLLQRVDLRQRLPRLACPSLWLFGERDTLVPARAADNIRALLPGARMALLQGAAHAPFLSHQRECIEALDAFAAELAQELA